MAKHIARNVLVRPVQTNTKNNGFSERTLNEQG